MLLKLPRVKTVPCYVPLEVLLRPAGGRGDSAFWSHILGVQNRNFSCRSYYLGPCCSLIWESEGVMEHLCWFFVCLFVCLHRRRLKKKIKRKGIEIHPRPLHKCLLFVCIPFSASQLQLYGIVFNALGKVLAFFLYNSSAASYFSWGSGHCEWQSHSLHVLFFELN